MDSKDIDMGDNAVDWNDPMFSNAQFDDVMPAESPLGVSSAFDNYTNLNDFAESPAGLTMRTPSKPIPDFTSTASTHHDPSHTLHMMPSTSVESSSQDSASDTSSRRKRKTTSESPVSDTHVEGERSAYANKDDSKMDMSGNKPIPRSHISQFKASQSTTHSVTDHSNMFDFNSAASSPINPGAFDAALSLDEQVQNIVNMPQVAAAHYTQPSPVQTINPATFTLDNSRDHSPNTSMNAFNSASPHAFFSTPSSESIDTYTGQGWPAVNQTPTWSNDFNSAQFTSPGALQITPSPTTANGAMAVSPATARKPASRTGRSRLHIAPISAKSRVETQISVIMTLETPPRNIESLHLPLQTIAKSKLLSREEVDAHKVLELHTMLVCTSAMRNPQLKKKAFRRAAQQDNAEIQRRAEQQRELGDEDRNDPKSTPDEDKPSNGGEVRICNNCIQRERKRAARKKLKKEEEQQHWEKYETERVVVFNSNEHLPFKPWEAPATQSKENAQSADDYTPPDGALQVIAAMRIACYCRHQNEKEGFQVIFTMKDHQGNIVAQDMSDSILITDDHKTHPPSFSTQMSDQVLYGAPVYAAPGLPTSYSMVDMSQHAQPGFTSSRSAGNLQSLAYGQQYNQQSHVHPIQTVGFASQATSTTATPTNSLSRPGSPTSAGHSGPNKKRKSSSFHRKVPSGLTMTPRVDTSLPPSSNMPSAVSMMSQFSPTTPAGGAFNGQGEPSYMTIPNNSGPAQFINSGPPTPIDNPQQYGLPQTSSGSGQRRDNLQQVPDYYQSLPGSRVNSRAPSPTMSASRPNLAAYARQQMSQASNSARPQAYPNPVAQPPAVDADPVLPMIHKITPTEGPVSGGTEVSIYGREFAQGMQVFFGDQPATAVTFYGDQALLCTSPPGRVGGVQVTVLPPGNFPQYNPSQANKPIFTYKNANEKVMEMALRFVSQQQTGNPNAWWSLTQQNASRWVQQSVNRSGFGSTYEGGNMHASESAALEATIMGMLDAAMAGEEADLPNPVDPASGTAESLLSLSCAVGLHRVVAALLARGANPDGRDGSGFTPLMHAALHGRTKVFQLLVAKGADAAIRSLWGYTALEVAPVEMRGLLQQILLNTPRTRSTRPTLHSRSSTGSFASSNISWDISSASLYESDSYCSGPSAPPSRRLSEHNALPMMMEEEEEDDVRRRESEQDSSQDDGNSSSMQARRAPPPAAMMAWHQSLALQIQQFQQSFQKHVPHFQLTLPPLPNLEDCHDNVMLRKLSALVHGRNGGVDCSSTILSDRQLPPPYSELFPEKSHSVVEGGGSGKEVVTVPAKSEGEHAQTLASSVSSGLQAWDVSELFSWLWVPLLVILTTALTHVVMPYVSTILAQAFTSARNGQPVLERIVT